jgi:hypothetical protein
MRATMHEQLLDELNANAVHIGDLVDRVPLGGLLERPADDEWAVAEVIGHVRAADAIWRQRILVALANDGAAVPDVDERSLQHLLDGSGLTLADQVSSYIFGRVELVGVLSAIDDRDWSRTCRHETRGEMAVVDCVDALLRHEREHMAQIDAIADGLTTSFDA